MLWDWLGVLNDIIGIEGRCGFDGRMEIHVMRVFFIWVFGYEGISIGFVERILVKDMINFYINWWN